MKMHTGLLVMYALFHALPETGGDALGWVIYWMLVAVSCVGLFSATMHEIRRAVRRG